MVLYEDNKAKYDAVSKDLFRLVQRDETVSYTHLTLPTILRV